MKLTRDSAPGGAKPESFDKSRRILIQFLIICLPLWLSFKFYGGPYQEQVQHYLSAILLIIIWALVVSLYRPGLREAPLLILLFVLLSLFELGCRTYPGLLEPLSYSFRDQQIFGAVCTLNRIPYYGVGAFIGYFVLKACRFK